MFKNIKNIILDLGGVILNIDPQQTIDAFTLLLKRPAIEVFEELKLNHIFKEFETGKITPEEFRNYLRKKINLPLSDEEIDTAINAMILNIPDIRIKWLQLASRYYSIYLFSNTNAIHYKKYNDELLKNQGFELKSLFKKAYFSHEIGFRKPAVEAFEFVINNSGVNPAETLFIDDLEENIIGAEKAGLQGLLLQQELSGFFLTKMV